jgi:hypothetical protein
MCFTNYEPDIKHQQEQNSNKKTTNYQKENLIDSNINDSMIKSPKKLISQEEIQTKESNSSISTAFSIKDFSK